jgi:oligo-1,6-glucosidase
MKGTPYIYQGEELGMTNNKHFSQIDQFRDIESYQGMNDLLSYGYTPSEAMECLRQFSRDNARTPMQWNASPHAGFCPEDVIPWIEVNPQYQEINAEQEMKDDNSVYHFYKKLIQYRHQSATIVYGDFSLIQKDNPDLFCYERTLGDESILVVCNFFDKKLSYEIPKAYRDKDTQLILCNTPHVSGILKPYEAFAIVKNHANMEGKKEEYGNDK